MQRLTKEQILSAQDRKTIIVPMPEWGGDVELRQLSMGEVEQINTLTDSNTRKALLALTISMVDETGKPLFTTGEIDLLGEKSVEAMKRLSQSVGELNGWTTPAAAALEKNSESGPTVASSSN